MREGSLVTLSAYATSTDALRPWAEWNRKSNGKPPLIGIVVQISTLDADDPKYKYYSKNERSRFYINWAGGNAPAGRYGKYAFHGGAYFYRNDLKYVRGKK